MQKSKIYPNVCFRPEVTCEAVDVLTSFTGGEKPCTSKMDIDLANGESWYYDIDEEFFADCRKEFKKSHYLKEWSLVIG